jgi:hypothetical protein
MGDDETRQEKGGPGAETNRVAVSRMRLRNALRKRATLRSASPATWRVKKKKEEKRQRQDRLKRVDKDPMPGFTDFARRNTP